MILRALCSLHATAYVYFIHLYELAAPNKQQVKSTPLSQPGM